MSLHAQIKTAFQKSHYSLATQRVYTHWMHRFAHAVGGARLREIGMDEIHRVLMDLTPGPRTSAYRQARNAILFLYADVLDKPLVDSGERVRQSVLSRERGRLSRDDVTRLFDAMPDNAWRLMAQMIYGGGARVDELLGCRVQDMDMSMLTLSVRGVRAGSGRIVVFPRGLSSAITAHMCRLRALWEQDRMDGFSAVPMSWAGMGGEGEVGKTFAWQWLFPARYATVTPDAQGMFRHHAAGASFRRVFHDAALRALGSRCVTPLMLRRAFAFHTQASDGRWESLDSRAPLAIQETRQHPTYLQREDTTENVHVMELAIDGAAYRVCCTRASPTVDLFAHDDATESIQFLGRVAV